MDFNFLLVIQKVSKLWKCSYLDYDQEVSRIFWRSELIPFFGNPFHVLKISFQIMTKKSAEFFGALN
jgi:hypothetical protein